MQVTVSNQIYIFLWSISGGILMALLYDLFRISRKSFATRNIIIYIEDIIYWVLAALLLFSVIFISNDGQIHGYTFIGVILGIIMYVLLLSTIVTRIITSILSLVKRIMLAIWKLITFPYRWIINLFSKPVVVTVRWLKKLFKLLNNKVIYYYRHNKIKLKRIKIRSKKN